MIWIDILILAIIGFGLLHGLYVGGVRELGSLLAIIAGVIFGKLLAPWTATQLIQWGVNEGLAHLTSYVLVFIVMALGVNLLARGLTSILKRADLGPFNRLVGALIGTLKYALLASLLLNLVDMIDPNEQLLSHDVRSRAICYSPVKSLAGVAWDEWKDSIQPHTTNHDK